MDGRLIIEDGTILDLLELIVGANRWEDKGKGRKRARARARAAAEAAAPPQQSDARARATSPTITTSSDELYELFLDDDQQYSCAYFTDPANSLEQAQADKKAHIAAKLALEPGQRVLDIGCGWGGMALYLHKVAGVDVLGITLSEEQLKIARQRAAAAGVSDHVKFELIDYRHARRHVRPHRLGRHVRACRRRALRRVLRQVPRAAEARRRDAAAHDRQARRRAERRPIPSPTNISSPAIICRRSAQMCAASEKVRLIASDVEILRLHYA